MHPLSIGNGEMCFIFKLLKEKSVMTYINIHLKGVLVFSGIFDLVCLLVVEIWHNVQKW